MRSTRFRADLSTLWLLGRPVHHSLSPLIQNTALELLGEKYLYLATSVEDKDFARVVETLPLLGAVGANVTVPYKLHAYRLCHHLSPEAQVMGAVNTLHFREGRVEGYNTDGLGWWNALGEQCPPSQRENALVIGAGGATRAICHTLLSQGGRSLKILNRTLSKAEALKDELLNHYPDAEVEVRPLTDFCALLDGQGLVVQTTSVGLHDEKSPVPLPSQWPENTFLSELIYGRTTALTRRASELGATVQDGLGMLCGQAALSLSIWLEREPSDIPLNSMLSAARAVVNKRREEFGT